MHPSINERLPAAQITQAASPWGHPSGRTASNTLCGKALERFGNLFGLAQPSDFFRVKIDFTQRPDSSLETDVFRVFGFAHKKLKKVLKTSGTLGDEALFNWLKKSGL